MINRFIFLLLLHCFGQFAFAQETTVAELASEVQGSLTARQFDFLKRELEIQDLIIRGVTRIHLQGGEFQIEESSKTVRKILGDALELKSYHFVSETAEELSDSQRRQLTNLIKKSISDNKIKNFLLEAKSFLLSKARNTGNFMKSGMRTHGFRAAIVYAVTQVLNWVVPAILAAKGHYLLASTVLAIPFPEMFAGGYIAIEKYLKKKHRILLLGGEAVYSSYNQMTTELRDFLRINNNFQVIDFTTKEGKNITVGIEKGSLPSKFKQAIGKNDNLNYQNLVRFMEENSILLDELTVVKNSNMDQMFKTIKLVQVINELGSLDDMVLFREEFDKFIKEVDHLVDYTHFRKWATRASFSKSFEQLHAYLKRMPRDIPPAVLDYVWSQKILPSLNNEMGFKFGNMKYYQKFRDLQDGYYEFRKNIFNEHSTRLTDDQWTKFMTYFERSTGVGNTCDVHFVRYYDNYVPN